MNFVDMWDLKGCPGKILRIKPTEIEVESHFSSKTQHLRSTEYIVCERVFLQLLSF